ncbi:MAG TPA: isoprenylcysteine carboxylmethyltransferase family protein [Candidatus Sulfotelmatobacter sp.]|nr:isoprenylcysteine carboxylmethyltransferase family protein [Candidatus Sulfotelmatobacter sp.]
MSGVNTRAWLGLVFVAVGMGVVLFTTAGTFHYWQAWVYVALFSGASLLITLYLMKKDPALLARRVSGGPTAEKETAQKVIMVFASLGFIALLAVPGLDHRLAWSRVPLWCVVLGDVLFIIGWTIIFFVFRENTFTSATIEVAADQRVISTGPYSVVRHPMYAGALLYCVGTPLALGSYWGLLAFAAMLPFLLWRLFDEERFLSRYLPGYTEYCARVRSRLIPGLF